MISKYSVKRPYTVLVAVVLVIVLGAVSLSKMTTDLLPDMSFQYALVITTDMGASPEQVESDVTSPIESAMATTSNIKNISSVSYNSYSIVTLEYEQNANMDSVVIEIQQSLDQVSGQWDDSIGTPMIMKVNPDMMPVLAAAVDKDGMDANAFSDYVKNDLAPALESLEGVASVTTTGQLEESVDVTLNQDKIDALNKKIQKKIDEQFEKSQKKIDAGKKKVESGKSSISQGSEQLNSAINQTMDQQKKLYKTEQDLKKQLAELKKQKASLEQIQTGIQTFMKSDAYTGIVTVLKDNPQLAESSEMQTQIKQVNAVVKKQFLALSSLGITVNTYEDLPAASAEVGKLLTEVNTGMKTIERAQQKVESGKVSLASALDTLNANASMTALQVSASSTELANAASSLESAQSKLDEAKDTAHDSADLNKVLSKDTITSLLAAQNFDMPAGYAMDGDTQYLIRVGDAVQDVDELKDLPLVDMGIDGIDTIRLSDVAEVKVTDNSDETYAVINGNPGIMLSMEKQTGYSTGEVTNRILD
ncbi:efflux RND transporter permease subunit, partial [Roseburia faecis]